MSRSASRLPPLSSLSSLLTPSPSHPALNIALSLLSLSASLRPPQLTHYAAVCLFFVFGARMLNESREASNAASDELEEVEAELSKKQATYTSVGTQDTVRIPRAPVRGGEGSTDHARECEWRGRAGGDTRHVLAPDGFGSVVVRAWGEGERRDGTAGRLSGVDLGLQARCVHTAGGCAAGRGGPERNGGGGGQRQAQDSAAGTHAYIACGAHC